MKITRIRSIEILISAPENSWHEVNQINIIFGHKILIILNFSYQQGFNERIEDTKVIEMNKKPTINPCVLCEDVYTELKKFKIEDEGILIDKIKEIITMYNIV